MVGLSEERHNSGGLVSPILGGIYLFIYFGLVRSEILSFVIREYKCMWGPLKSLEREKKINDCCGAFKKVSSRTPRFIPHLPRFPTFEPSQLRAHPTGTAYFGISSPFALVLDFDKSKH